MENFMRKRMDRLYGSKDLWLFAPYGALPASFPEDMKELFSADPETDICNGVYWSDEGPYWSGNGVLAFVQGDLSDVQEKLLAYIQEKELIWLDIIYYDGENMCQKRFDEEEKKYVDVADVFVQEYNEMVDDGSLNIYMEYAKPGFGSGENKAKKEKR